MYKYLLILCLTINVSFASAVKLIDYLVSGSGVIEILAKHGIHGEDALKVKSYLSSALKSLGSKGDVSKQELLSLIAKMPTTGPDAQVRKSLQMLLDTSAENIKKSDMVEAINNIIYLANRHGKSIIITCSECVNEQLAKDGFKFAVETIKSASVTQLLDEVIPTNPAELNSFIASRMKRLKMGDYSKATPAQILPEEEKSLAVFLGLAEVGSKEQKALIASIKKLSTKNGQTDILGSQHKMWKILTDDMSNKVLEGWTRTLDEVAERASKDGISVEDAFYRTLKDKAEGNEVLMAEYKALKAKGCFFK